MSNNDDITKRHEKYLELKKTGMNKVQAYQIAYGVSYEEAIDMANKERYEMLKSMGFNVRLIDNNNIGSKKR